MKQNIVKQLLLASILVFFVSIAYADKQPDWVSGQSKNYPDKDYLSGVGIAKTLDMARSNARAEISKIFQVVISQISSQIEKEQTKVKGGSKEISSGIKAEVQTNSSTNDVLEGVSIQETWFDKKNKDYYALAVLDKKKLSAYLSDRIMELEKTIRSEFQATGKEDPPVEKLRALSMSINANKKISELANKKRIVDTVSMPDINGTSLAELEKMRQQEIRKIVFVTLDESKDEYKLKDIVNKSITSLGFNVNSSVAKSADSTKGMVIIRCKLELKPSSREAKGWRFYNWESTVDMFDGITNGKLLSSISPKGSASGTTESSAMEKTLYSAKEEMGSAIKEMISKYMFNE